MIPQQICVFFCSLGHRCCWLVLVYDHERLLLATLPTKPMTCMWAVPLYCCCAAAPAPDPTLLLGQSEAYVEYDRAGRLIRGNEPVKRSRCGNMLILRAPGVGGRGVVNIVLMMLQRVAELSNQIYGLTAADRLEVAPLPLTAVAGTDASAPRLGHQNVQELDLSACAH